MQTMHVVNTLDADTCKNRPCGVPMISRADIGDNDNSEWRFDNRDLERALAVLLM